MRSRSFLGSVRSSFRSNSRFERCVGCVFRLVLGAICVLFIFVLLIAVQVWSLLALYVVFVVVLVVVCCSWLLLFCMLLLFVVIIVIRIGVGLALEGGHRVGLGKWRSKGDGPPALGPVFVLSVVLLVEYI